MTDTGQFLDRRDAGRQLATALAAYRGRDNLLVLGLPRGGVPVAYEVAQALRAPLDVLIVRKLGVPGHEELAMGAIASGGGRVINEQVVNSLGISNGAMTAVADKERRELQRREQRYRGEREPLVVRDRTVIVVDDGVATGATVSAAIQALRRLGPAELVLAVPTAPADTCARLAEEADELICLTSPRPFHAVGQMYRQFDQTSDEEVIRLLAAAQNAGPSGE